MLGGLCVSLAATAADAREARYRLSIEPKSYAEALIDLGFQADVSVLGTSACGAGGGVSLKGDFTLEEALRRLTAGAPCSYRILDPRTVRIGPPAPAPAAETPKAPPTLVAELLVTATKRPAGINRLPAAISVIPHSQIALTGAEDVGETAAQASGVFTTNLGPGRDKVILRGLSDGAFTGHARSTVGSYLDDVPINYNAPDPDLRLVDVERIEVVRGPQGALYGSGALSGVYRIVTGKPNLAALETGLTGETAWTQGGSASRALEGYLSVPLVNDQLAVRLAGYYDLQAATSTISASGCRTSTGPGAMAAVWRFDISPTRPGRPISRSSASGCAPTTPTTRPRRRGGTSAAAWSRRPTRTTSTRRA